MTHRKKRMIHSLTQTNSLVHSISRHQLKLLKPVKVIMISAQKQLRKETFQFLLRIQISTGNKSAIDIIFRKTSSALYRICYKLICIIYPNSQYLVLLIFDKKNGTSAKDCRSNLIMTHFAKLGKS